MQVMSKLKYPVVLGKDILLELGVIIDTNNQTFVWDGLTIPMWKPSDRGVSTESRMKETGWLMELDSYPKLVKETDERRDQILDAKYAPVNLEKLAYRKDLDKTFQKVK